MADDLAPGLGLDFAGGAFFVRVYMPPSGNVQIVDPALLLANISPGGEGAFADPNTFDATPYVTSVELSIQGSGGYTFATVELAPPIEKALELLDTALIADGNIMLLQMGYPESGHTTDIYGLRTTPASVKANGQRTGITLHANGEFHFDTSRRHVDKVWEPGNPGTAYGILSQIANKYGWRVAFAPTQTTAPPDPVVTPPQLLRKITRPIHQTETDWEFIEKLLMAFNCVLGVEISTRSLIVQDYDDINDATPITTLRMWGQMDVQNNVFPLKSFEMDPQIYFQAPQGIKSRVRHGPNQEDGTQAVLTPIEPKLDANNVPAQNGVAFGADSMTGKATTTPDGVTVSAPPPYAPNEIGRNYYKPQRDVFKDGVQVTAKDATYFSGLQGVAKTIGNPLLRVDQLVKIDGLGDNMSGPWKINHLIHSFSGSSFETTLDLIKASVTVEAEGKLTPNGIATTEGSPAPKSNTKTADGGATSLVSPAVEKLR